MPDEVATWEDDGGQPEVDVTPTELTFTVNQDPRHEFVYVAIPNGATVTIRLAESGFPITTWAQSAEAVRAMKPTILGTEAK